MLSIVMNLDVMSWCVLLFCRDALSVRVTGWCHQTPLCVLKSRALSSMKPYIYLKILYSSFFRGPVLYWVYAELKGLAFSALQQKHSLTRVKRVQFLCSERNCHLSYLSCVCVCVRVRLRVCARACVCFRTYTFKWGFVETAWKNQLDHVKIVKVYKWLFNRCISFRFHYKNKKTTIGLCC